MINFRQYPNLTKCVVPNSIRLSNDNFSSKFYLMFNLKEITLPKNITNMADIFVQCYNLITPPVCGENVINMNHAYTYCYNLTGSPVCGPNVTDMVYTLVFFPLLYVHISEFTFITVLFVFVCPDHVSTQNT